jgi:steroid delta-isomerase-like uncharacterized protein
MSNEERNKANFMKLFDEVINTGNMDLADDLIVEERPDHAQGIPPEFAKGRQGFKNFFTMFRGAFPDAKFNNELWVAQGDVVACYGTCIGTHTGNFMGIPATGKKINVTNADFCRFNNEGKITEHWGIFNTMALMQQLGVVPTPGQ